MNAIYKGYKIYVTKTKDPNIYNAQVILGVYGNPYPPPDDLFVNMKCYARGEYSGHVNSNDPDLKLLGDDIMPKY